MISSGEWSKTVFTIIQSHRDMTNDFLFSFCWQVNRNDRPSFVGLRMRSAQCARDSKIARAKCDLLHWNSGHQCHVTSVQSTREGVVTLFSCFFFGKKKKWKKNWKKFFFQQFRSTCGHIWAIDWKCWWLTM